MNVKKATLAGIAASLLATVAFAVRLNVSRPTPTTTTVEPQFPPTGPASRRNTYFDYGPGKPTRTALATAPAPIPAPAPATQPNLPPDIGPGTWCGHVRHTNTYGEMSAWSAIGVKTGANPVPNAPTNFSMGSQQP
jgi:hypothetical protein